MGLALLSVGGSAQGLLWPAPMTELPSACQALLGAAGSLAKE